jgi:flagellar transcriptional activator FlhC
MLQTASCTQCAGHFVVHAHDLNNRFVCGLCNVPSRAGKTNKPRTITYTAMAA